MSEFVNTFPPPPYFYKLFADPSFTMKPPAIVELKNKEIYGGSMLLPESGEDKHNPDCNYREELKRCLREFVMEGLNFVSDKNPRQSFDNGAIAIETKSTLLYKLLNEYRSHEAREMLCQEMRRQVADLQELKASLTSTLEETTSLYEEKG